MTSPSTKRLLKESTDLHKNPSPYFTASPTSDSNLHDWHFTLAGPPSPSPYAHGLYHGRITFPPAYPMRPPSFRFLTPSGRFEVNREICLSISGHHEETWQPAWGVRTALLAIRSEIMSGEAKGQVGGMESSGEIRREFARESTEWTCRECGKSNAAIMRELWDACRERGVEVDVEGHGSSQQDRAGQGWREWGEAPPPEDEAATAAATAAARATATSPELGHGGSPQAEPLQGGKTQGPTEEVDNLPSVVAAPASGLALSPGEGSETATRPQPRPAAAAAATAVSAPASNPWLDRAIMAIAFALIVMVLRRVSDVNDL
ncbi:Ubiquitin-conjugating enzyme [Penicillium chermesinum]|uniref:Ubiquitin-conjugating enzyme n=1 Tax=Penicillium chermesinum TaxID=63820 RepID=A0A9W9P7I4_9EURO|nr:Ubiquitin-conjugating enzyme [Penicillium chermesinum]KAJ5239264.1 Ubiquitin-conjugating enzyme [Penicillium chermesinum]